MSPWVTASASDSPALRYAPATESLRPVDPAPARTALPQATKVLAVIARPGQESAHLGALLYAFRRAGASLALLSLTRGEASPLNSTRECLETRRPWELQVAGAILGVSSVAEPGTHGGHLADLGADPAVARAVQRSAVAAHASQSEALPEVNRRLTLLDDRETLRWLVPAPAVSLPPQ